MYMTNSKLNGSLHTESLFFGNLTATGLKCCRGKKLFIQQAYKIAAPIHSHGLSCKVTPNLSQLPVPGVCMSIYSKPPNLHSINVLVWPFGAQQPNLIPADIFRVYAIPIWYPYMVSLLATSYEPIHCTRPGTGKTKAKM